MTLSSDEVLACLTGRVVNLDVPSMGIVVQHPKLAAIPPQLCGHAGYLISSTDRCLVCSALTYEEGPRGRAAN